MLSRCTRLTESSARASLILLPSQERDSALILFFLLFLLISGFSTESSFLTFPNYIDFLSDQKSTHRDSILMPLMQILYCDPAAGFNGSSFNWTP